MRIFGILGATAIYLGSVGTAEAAATAAFTPSRTSGTAPLAVFFDASASTCEGCDGVVDAWHDLGYRWRFGDPDAGTWALSGRGKNVDVGPSAAHVFEAPGHYVVELTVTDPVSGQTSTVSHEVDVADPAQVFADTTTCYRASDSGDFAGCPDGAAQKTMASFTAAYDDCKGAGRRCLFRRGDVFTAGATVKLDGSAPDTIGAFGRGERPEVDASKLGAGVLFSGGMGGGDYRIMDLSLRGPKVQSSKAYSATQVQKDVLLLRVEAVPDTWHTVVEQEQTLLGTKGWHEHMFVVECEVLKAGFGSGGNIVFVTWKRSALLGNDLQDTRTGEHIIRAGAYDNLLIAHNRLGAAASIRHVITLRSSDAAKPCQGGVCAPSVKGVISANTLHMTNGWTVQVCGRAMGEDNRCEDTIVDGNFAFVDPKYPIKSDPTVVYNLADGDTISYRTSFRNNICDMNGAVNHCADLKVGTLARAYNNTCYRGDGGKIDSCIYTYGKTPAGISTRAQNNLAFGDGVVNVVGGDWSVNDHNVEAMGNPFVAAMPGFVPADYQLADGSPAIDAGALVANGFDFAGLPRPAGPSLDVGAWEYGAIDDSEPLVVSLGLPPQPHAALAGFTLTATTSGGSGAPSFAWDCDGDGTFEASSDGVAQVDCPGLAAGTHDVGVRATDASGSDDDVLALTIAGSCGDDTKDDGEQCDGADLGGESCGSRGFVDGVLGCTQCMFDTSGCTGQGPDTGTTGSLETGDLPTTGGAGEASSGTDGSNDVGGGSSGGSAGGTAGTSGPDADGGADEGCGCRTTSPGSGGAGLAALVLLAGRRRREVGVPRTRRS